MSQTTSIYTEGLNPPQAQAVQHHDGPLLVLAGAGSGKTRVITHRIADLIHTGVSPSAILAVTFTNKAATEMRERVLDLLQRDPSASMTGHGGRPLVTTFHSLGVRILREHHATLQLSRHFTIYDRSDSQKAVKRALEEAGYSPKQFEPKKILGQISRAKGDAKTHTEFLQEASSYPERVAAEIWQRYEDLLRKEHALDFDDLLSKTLYLLKNYPTVRETLTKRWHYIHVDEYQDTNRVQFEIIKQLTPAPYNICAVGDVDQNIYSWRGADITNVMQFERVFPGAQTIFLEQNYRSTKTIIAASNQIIDKNRNRIEKTVFTTNDTGEKINLFAARNGIAEAEYVASSIATLIADGMAPSAIAVLYRTNFQSRVLEEAFLTRELPYQLLGTKFYERKEVKDVLSFLRLAINPDSSADLTRIVNVPTRGIGKVTLQKLLAGERDTLTGATAQKVERFEAIMEDIRIHSQTESLASTLKFIIARTGMETEFKKQGTDEDLSRLENLQELVTLAARYSDLEPAAAIEALLENAALQSDQDELVGKEEIEAVRLMTVHAAKGLEFPHVFITGLEEGLFPHERLDDRGVDHEEERRLFYVALTRAESQLHLSYAHTRMIFGSERVNVPSSFLNDIDTEHIQYANHDHSHGSSGYETTIFLD